MGPPKKTEKAPPKTKSGATEKKGGKSGTLSDEQLLLSRAQTALARQNHKQALEAIETHKQKFPDGALLEERRVLEIRILMRLGKIELAHQKADKFLEDHPNSIFKESVSKLEKRAKQQKQSAD